LVSLLLPPPSAPAPVLCVTQTPTLSEVPVRPALSAPPVAPVPQLSHAQFARLPPAMLTTGTAPVTPSCSFVVGAEVVIDGLSAATHFNGKRATVKLFDSVLERFEILVHKPDGSRQLAKVKSENLRLAFPVAAIAGSSPQSPTHEPSFTLEVSRNGTQCCAADSQVFAVVPSPTRRSGRSVVEEMLPAR